MKPIKPLGQKSYGSIGHLPGSRLGPADRCVNHGQARIATERTRDKRDTVVVQEKLDGSNVAVANVDGEIIALMRAGYRAIDSRREMHHLFDAWVRERKGWFSWLLEPGERLAGEWLAQAHGTRYLITNPDRAFVAFDIMRDGHKRATWDEIWERCSSIPLQLAYPVHIGSALPVDEALDLIGAGVHGALDPVEGAVWRVERDGRVDFLAKYVRHDKVDGLYFKDGPAWTAPVWNWHPDPNRISRDVLERRAVAS